MRIIASDYDGTFNAGGITRKKIKAVARWQKKGNFFGIVSGRDLTFLVETLQQDGVLCDFFLANNGAVIADGKGKILWEKTIPTELTLPILHALFRCGCPIGKVCDREFIDIIPDAAQLQKGQVFLSDAPTFSVVHQISTFLPTLEETERVIASIREQFGEWVTPLQNGTCIDIVPAHMDKKVGIEMLLQLLDAQPQDVITVGDNVNDTAMIEGFYSYAVENAVDSIKRKATRITLGMTELIETELKKESDK